MTPKRMEIPSFEYALKIPFLVYNFAHYVEILVPESQDNGLMIRPNILTSFLFLYKLNYAHSK